MAEVGPARSLALVALLWSGAGTASAQHFEVYVVGSATIRDAVVEVSCAEAAQPSRIQCESRSRYTLHADGEVELSVRRLRVGDPPPGVDITVRIDGRHVPERARIEIGRTVSVEVLAHATAPREPEPLTGAPDFSDEPFQLSAIRTRHPFLGHRLPSEGSTAPMMHFVAAGGPDLRVVGPVRYTTSRASGVDVSEPWPGHGPSVGATARVHAPERTILHGGPFLALGGWVGWGSHPPGPRFALRAGYEIALFEILVAGLAFETDFESIAQSLVVEIASPEIWFLVPSFGVGVGVVVRELGDRDADAALRLRGTLTWALLGFMADFDYWPSIGGWSGTFAARFGF